MAGKFDVEELERNWKWSEGDPEELFVLEEEIASGSFGSVYKARHVEDNNIYALKIIQPEEDDDVSEFIELHILQRCHHPNIVGLLGTWKKGDEIFIAQDYCGGGAISDMPQVWDIELKEEQIALLCRETLRGLKYLHENCIIHRDIKGANILLTESGDVKLIDFGVSAVLATRDEKRNTLIGTPYWMAPEIISNKNGKNPYDERIDLWSLGITCIELAEKEPPLSEVHPMRALMQIPIRDAPTLQNTKKWSREFVDFVKECLMKDHKKRHTAEELLLHPFVANLGEDKRCLVQLIEDAKRAKLKVVAEEESSMDDGPKRDDNGVADEEDVDEALSSIPAPLPVSPGPNASDSPTSASPISGDTKPRAVSDASDLAKPGERSGTLSAATATANGENTAAKRRAPSEAGSGPSVAAAAKAKRTPTVRATLKQPSVTRREMEIKQAKIMNKALMMQQLKELAAQRAIHMKELEKLRKAHKREADTLEAEYKSATMRLKDATSSRDKTMADRHASEQERTLKRHRSEATDGQSNAQRDEKRTLRDLESRQKSVLAEFKESQRATRKEAEKEHKETKKAKKAEFKPLGKKEKTQAEADLKSESAAFKLNIDQLEEQGLRKKGYIQARERFTLMADVATTVLHDLHTKTLEQLWELWDLKEKQLGERHDSAKTFDSELEDLEKAFMKRRIALQVSHLEKEHALIRQQLDKEQAVEKAQQSKILKSDQRAALKEWAKQKAQRHKDFLKTSKESMKSKMSLKREERAALQTSMQDDFNAKQKTLDQEFTAKQMKEMADEEQLLAHHHASQLEALAVDQKAEMETMTTEHTKTTASQEERIRVTNALHARNFWEERWALLRERQKAVMELRKAQHTEQKQLLSTQTSELAALHAAQLAELQQLMQTQQRSELELQAMQAEFAADRVEMEAKQQQAEAQLVDVIRKNVVTIKTEHKAARKALSAVAPPRGEEAVGNSNSHTGVESESEDDSIHSHSNSSPGLLAPTPTTPRRASHQLPAPPSLAQTEVSHSDGSESVDGSSDTDGIGVIPVPLNVIPATPNRRGSVAQESSDTTTGSHLSLAPGSTKRSSDKAGRRGSQKPASPSPPLGDHLSVASPLPPPLTSSASLESSTGSNGQNGSDSHSPGHSRKTSESTSSTPSKKRHTRHTSSQSPLPNMNDLPVPISSPDSTSSSSKKKKKRTKTEVSTPLRSPSPSIQDSDSD
jgi:serine/threonine protein kinase